MRQTFGLLLAAIALICAGQTANALSAPERINAALPPEGTHASEVRLAAVLTEFGLPADAVMSAWRKRLVERAQTCARGYAPGPFASPEEIRLKLTDVACFQQEDRALRDWLDWRIAGVLLAAPPLRPLPSTVPAAINVDGYVMSALFADAAGTVVVSAGTRLDVIDLATGKRLFTQPYGNIRTGQVSPNGRLLTVDRDGKTRFLDLEHGDFLLELDTSDATNLQWLDNQTAITGLPKRKGSMLLDFVAGRTVPIPWMNHEVSGAAAMPGQPGVYTIVHATGLARIKLERSATGVEAIALDEMFPENNARVMHGIFSPDGRYFLTQQSLDVIDVMAWTYTRHDLTPVYVPDFRLPGPGPDTFLVDVRMPEGNDISYVFSPRDGTLAVANISKLINHAFYRGARTLLHKENNRIERATVSGANPVSLQEIVSSAKRASVKAPGTPSGWVEVVGIYEGPSEGVPVPNVHVDVRPTTKTDRVLVLSSYESVNWVLSGSGLASLKAILVSSYEQSTVKNAPKTIPLKVVGQASAHERGGSDYFRLEKEIRAEVGRGIDSFQGAYHGKDFTVGP